MSCFTLTIYFIISYVIGLEQIVCDPNCDLFTLGNHSESQQILDSINNFRYNIASGNINGHPNYGPLPSATNMNKILWDNQLAIISSNHANTCPGMVSILSQNGNLPSIIAQSVNANLTKFKYKELNQNTIASYYVGMAVDNIQTFPNILNLFQTQWFDQVSLYQFIPPDGTHIECPGNENTFGCDIIQALISANVRYIGCGYSFCGRSTNFTVIICNLYPDPIGLYISQRPYKQGPPCSLCDDDRTCINNLCGGGVCDSYGDSPCNNTNDCLDGTELDGRSLFGCPTIPPTSSPTTQTLSPTLNTIEPSFSPTNYPTQNPSTSPTSTPSLTPTLSPSTNPSVSPTQSPTVPPTSLPTMVPSTSNNPSSSPTTNTFQPSISPNTNESAQQNKKLEQTALTFIVVSGILLILIIIFLFCWLISRRKLMHRMKSSINKKSEVSEPLSSVNSGNDLELGKSAVDSGSHNKTPGEAQKSLSHDNKREGISNKTTADVISDDSVDLGVNNDNDDDDIYGPGKKMSKKGYSIEGSQSHSNAGIITNNDNPAIFKKNSNPNGESTDDENELYNPKYNRKTTKDINDV